MSNKLLRYLILILLSIKIVFANDVSPLAQAIIENDTKKAIQLIKSGEDLLGFENEHTIRQIVTPNVKVTYVGGIDKKVYPLVILASANGNDEIIKAIKKKKNEAIYLKDKYKTDALMWASRQGHLSTVKLLLSYGFNPLYEASNTNAFELSIQKEKYKILKLFIKHLVKNKNTKLLSYTMWRMARHDADIVEQLVKMGIKDTYKAVSPRTTLIKVAEIGNIERFNLLVNNGSNPYESNRDSVNYGYNPLIAAINNSSKLTKHLLENFNYDLSVIYEDKNLLHLSYNRYQRLDKDIIKLILKKSSIDINSKDEYKRTILQVAVSNIDKEYVKFFLSLGYEEENLYNAMQIAKDRIQGWERQYKKVNNPHNLKKVNDSKEILEILKKESNNSDS